MPYKKSKKILIYFFLFLLIGTFNNKNINNFNDLKINSIYVLGLSEKKNIEVQKSFEFLKFQNLFLLKKIQIEKLLNSFNYIENYSVYKKFPSTLKVELNETKYLVYVTKDNKNFYLGSNGKLIPTSYQKNNLPYIFGTLDTRKFFELKEIMDKFNFDFKKIKKLFFFPSGRWDLELNNGMMIKLSRDRLEENFKLFLAILKDENFKDISVIDMRQSDQVIINE